MTKQEIIKAVTEEIERIKIIATLRELSLLDKETFNPMSIYNCLYGQMTVNSYSSRAREITPKTYHNISIECFKEGRYFTILEKYLYRSYRDVYENIIDYIKGDAKELKLTEEHL